MANKIEQPEQTETKQTDSFSEMIQKAPYEFKENTIIKGKVINIIKESIIIDAGLKSESVIGKHEFEDIDGNINVQIGDEIDLYVENMDNSNGEVVLGYERVKKEQLWEDLQTKMEKKELVEGKIISKIRSGYSVDLGSMKAFLPNSQVDITHVRDITPLLQVKHQFLIFKMDKKRNNIVVSRKAVIEGNTEAKSDIIAKLEEGMVVSGKVKNITDYGAFVDLGGADGLLYITDISWQRISHPSSVLEPGQTVDVKIIKINPENNRVSLSMKQLTEDPWGKVAEQFTIGQKYKGKVSNMADYGIFVELKPGIEGVVYTSELLWNKKNIHPKKLYEINDTVEVKVLDIDNEKRRINLGIKQCVDNPWIKFGAENKVGDIIEAKIARFTEYCMFVSVNDHIDAMVHVSDISWDSSSSSLLANYKKDEIIKVKVLDINSEKERIACGIKQLTDDPFENEIKKIEKGQIVEATVIGIPEQGLEVVFSENNIRGFIKKSEIAIERSKQRPSLFSKDNKVQAKIIQINQESRSIYLSIKAKEIDLEKSTLKKYNEVDRGSSLKDILGKSLSDQKTKKD